MSTVNFEFSRWEDGELSGFDLGDITVIGPHGMHSSRDKAPDQSVMIYLSIAHLLSGICDLSSGRKRVFEFVGADSSYSIIFSRKKDVVAISGGRKPIGETSTRELLRAVCAGVHTFLSDPKNQLPPADPAYEDLHASLAKLRAEMRSAG